jgi:branched-chain amino acid transport system ATP-binding protein
MLEVKNLSVTYNGNIKALKEININVNQGELVVLIGANGAGKTTLLKALTGLIKVNSGSFANLDLTGLTDKRTLNRFCGPKTTDKLLASFETSDQVFEFLQRAEIDHLSPVKGLSPEKVRKLQVKYHKYATADLLRVPAHNAIMYGVAHVPEGRQVFANLTVQENLEMGAYKRHNSQKIKEDLKEVFARFPRLEERKKQKAGTLSGGEQQMLAMARAMMSKPKILLLDEPSMGLSPIFVNEIFDIIKSLHESGTTILLVEQNAKAALSIADRAYVLETGKVVLEGDAKELLNNEDVKKAYLGA